MSFIGKIIILAIVLLFAVIGYAHYLSTITSDEEAQKVYQEYLEYKARREKENNGRKNNL